MELVQEALSFFVQRPGRFGPQQAASTSGDLSIGMIVAFSTIFFIIGLAFYVYFSLALMTIAKKTHTDPAWLAWIPLANIYLVVKIANAPWWTMLLLLLGVIPILGQIGTMVLWAYWWWHVAEYRGKPGWWGILMLLPLVNLVMIGLLAWTE